MRIMAGASFAWMIDGFRSGQRGQDKGTLPARTLVTAHPPAAGMNDTLVSLQCNTVFK
jgi:hypothetical protein